jgi:hypothetical protein
VIAMLDQLRAGGQQGLARPAAVHPGLAAQEPADPLGWIVEGLLEPVVEHLLEQGGRLLLGHDHEARVDDRLDRPLAQDVGAEPVDGADAGQLQLSERAIEPGLLLGRGVRRAALAIDLGAQAQLHLAGRLVGEGDRDDAFQLRPPGPDERQDAPDQRRGLAGPGRGLDHEGGVEIVPDALARRGVGQHRRHGCFLSRTSGSIRRESLRAERCCSYGPHTAM